MASRNALSTAALPPPEDWHATPSAMRLLPSWPLSLMFGGLILWWFLGVSGFVQFIFAIPMLVALARRGNVRMPRRFGLWFIFLGFNFASAIQIIAVKNSQQLNNLLSWGWRATVYVGATITFLYVYNMSREQLPAKRIINILAAFWVLTVIGGLMGMALPNHTFSSIMEKLMPQHFLANAFVKALVIPSTTGAKTFPGLGIYRVKAPFIYTNQWGSAFALTLPFALAVVTETKSKLNRNIFLGLLVLGIVPLVFSLDRGSWLSAGVGTLYGIIRMSASGKSRTRKMARAARSLLLAGVLVGAIVLVSPLGHYILTRTQNGYGDQHRALLYSSSLTLVVRRPILGYGSPVALNVLDPNAPPGPSIGTHGTLWTILVSNGVPAMFFFGLWFLYGFTRTYKRIRSRNGANAEAFFWCHVVILTAIIQLPYYELLPWGLPIVMIAMAVGLRERAVANAPARFVPPPAPSLAPAGLRP